MKNLADSGLLIALLDRADAHHGWARAVINTVEPPFLTCDAVCTEVAAVIGTADPVLQMIERGDLRLDFDLQTEASHVRRLIRKYADQPMDLADGCMVRMSELHAHCRIFTVDQRDFLVYRRNGRQPVPCVFPSSARKRR